MKCLGCLYHSLQYDTSQKLSESPSTSVTVRPNISDCGCILMTTIHNRLYQNTLYRYEEDLIGVWSGWGVLIIVYSMIQVRNRVNHLLPLWLWDQDISDCGCILMTTSQSLRCQNTFYMHEDHLIGVWCVWGASIIVYSMIQVRN
jgi:hypothetical protein